MLVSAAVPCSNKLMNFIENVSNLEYERNIYEMHILCMYTRKEITQLYSYDFIVEVGGLKL